SFSDITNGDPLAMYWLSPRGVTWQDVNLDGYVDLYVTNSGGDQRKKRLMINQGDNTFVLDESAGLLGTWLEGRGAAWTDFNNDGLADVYVVAGAEDHSEEVYRRNSLYKNNGDGTWSNVANSAGVADVGHGRGCAWGDINNDGFMDLIVGNQVGSDHPGNNKLYVNNGDETFTDISESSGISFNERTRCVSMADYDNDGFLDLYTVTFGSSAPANQLFHNNHDLTFTNTAAGTPITAPNNGNSASWSDFDNDGWIDIYTVGGSPTAPGVGHNRLLRNTNHNGNHWIEFELCGTTTNRSAIGTRVVIKYHNELDEVVVQMREVQSGSGYNSQHMFRTHFGLGQSTTINEVTITWPSGIVQTTTNFAVDQILRIVESDVFAIDCNRNCVDDYYDIIDGTSTDFDENGIPDECDCNPHVDCNENCIDDELDILNGTSADEDENGIPDECDCNPVYDCNENCIEDAIDIENGTSLDNDDNGIPDECDCPVVYDCNNNCIEDSVDINTGYSYDLDGNGIPDECECAADFNGNGDVDIEDLMILLEHWYETGSIADLTGDDFVDIEDLLVYIASFGPCE
ncbi:MAG: CRTAC1 family protein, partial [Phycisphaerae bacterium]|nr:CRTAC1 family protein [Phycisphaerae bacterium]